MKNCIVTNSGCSKESVSPMFRCTTQQKALFQHWAKTNEIILSKTIVNILRTISLEKELVVKDNNTVVHKNSMISVRVSPSTHAYLKTDAKVLGISLSTLIFSIINQLMDNALYECEKMKEENGF